MSKELEALKSIKGTIISSTRGDWGFEYRYVSDIESTKEHFDIIEQALKRNEPVRLLVHDDNYAMLEAKSAEDYNYDEWYCAMGYCPICGEQNPIGNNFCGKCGNKLDKFWKEK